MPVAANTIEEGKCYKTANNQHRRVVKIDDGKVTYESWGGNVGYPGDHLHRTTASLETFADAVEEEFACPTTLPPMPTL